MPESMKGGLVFRCKLKEKAAIRTYTYYFVKHRMTETPTFLSGGSGPSALSDLAIDDPGRRRLPPLLRKAWLKLNAIFLHRVADIGITPDQYIALRWLAERGNPGLTQRELGDCMASDPNTIASLLRRMEKAGWIRRRPRVLDRRAKDVTSTRAGQMIFKKARARALDLEKTVLQVLSQRERKVFLSSLEKVASSCMKSSDSKILD
jgi:DNA-binding MarR family transcriptional regulator